MTESNRTGRGRTLLLLASILLAALVVLGGGLSSVRKIESFQPTGFTAERDAGNWAVQSADPGTGLVAGDAILLVNGDTVATAAELAGELKAAPASDLVVLRGEELVEVDYARPALDIDFAYLVLALIGCAYLLVGFYTLLRDQRGAAVVFFLWTLTSAVVYLFSPAGPFDLVDKTLYVAEEFARILLAPLTLHLFSIFPKPLGGKRRRLGAGWMTPFFYLPAAFLALLQLDLLATGGRMLFGASAGTALATLDRLELFHLVVFGLAAAGVLAWRLWTGKQGEAQQQTSWIAAGMVGGYLPFGLLYVLPRALGASWPDTLAPVTVLFLAIVPIAFSYAILRYRLWDLGVVVRDSVTLGLTVLLGVSGFALANQVVNRMMPTDLAMGRNLLVFLSGLTIAGLMVPTHRGLGQSLERLQYRGRFGRRRALAEIGRDLLNERDLNLLCERLTDEIRSSLEIDTSNLLLVRDGIVVPWRAEPALDETVSFGDLPESLWNPGVHGLPAVGLPGEDTAGVALFGAGYRYALPLFVRERRVGLFVCGYKDGSVPLSSDDLDLLESLLNQTALAIENAQLLETVQSQLEEVVRLQQFNKEIVESSPAGIVVLGPDEAVVSANRAFAGLFGLAVEEITGRRVADFLPGTPLPAPGDGLRETRIEPAQGTERYLQISAGALPGAAESSSQRVLVVQDVTDRIAMENALKEKDRLAALGVLAAGVAHEVNTPITGISSYAQMLLQDTPDDDPRHQLLRKVETQTFRAARIVNNLLNFARKRGGEQISVDLGPLVDECLDLVRERLHEHGVGLVWQRPDQPITVLGNEGELQQVVTNLVMNAIDAMGGTGGSLTVEIETNGSWAWIGVEDTGPGIAPGQLESIFEPFYSTKLDQGGTGLGLSISHDLIRRHRGDIRVVSQLGEGSRFIIELPTAENPPESSNE